MQDGAHAPAAPEPGERDVTDEAARLGQGSEGARPEHGDAHVVPAARLVAEDLPAQADHAAVGVEPDRPRPARARHDHQGEAVVGSRGELDERRLYHHVAVVDQDRRRPEPRPRPRHPPRRPPDHRLVHGVEANGEAVEPGREGLRQPVRVEQGLPVAGRRELLGDGGQERPIAERDQGLRQLLGQRPEPGPEPGREDHRARHGRSMVEPRRTAQIRPVLGRKLRAQGGRVVAASA